jgi:maleamate amidohydrolase
VAAEDVRTKLGALYDLGSGLFSEDDLLVYSRYVRDNRAPVDWSRPVLLVVDTSEAFLGPDVPTAEATASCRTACGRPAWAALEKIRQLIETFRAADGRVVYTIPDWDNEPQFGGTTIGSAQRIEDRLAPGLEPRADELLIKKAKASAFFGTALPTYLTRHRASVIVLVGGTTSGCVRASAIDASSYGWDVVLPLDGCFDRAETSHRVSAFELGGKYARLSSAAEVRAALVPRG